MDYYRAQNSTLSVFMLNQINPGNNSQILFREHPFQYDTPI